MRSEIFIRNKKTDKSSPYRCPVCKGYALFQYRNDMLAIDCGSCLQICSARHHCQTTNNDTQQIQCSSWQRKQSCIAASSKSFHPTSNSCSMHIHSPPPSTLPMQTPNWAEPSLHETSFRRRSDSCGLLFSASKMASPPAAPSRLWLRSRSVTRICARYCVPDGVLSVNRGNGHADTLYEGVKLMRWGKLCWYRHHLHLSVPVRRSWIVPLDNNFFGTLIAAWELGVSGCCSATNLTDKSGYLPILGATTGFCLISANL